MHRCIFWTAWVLWHAESDRRPAVDTHLGGEDFDAAMQDHMVGVFKKQNKGKDLFVDAAGAAGGDVTYCV